MALAYVHIRYTFWVREGVIGIRFCFNAIEFCLVRGRDDSNSWYGNGKREIIHPP